MRQVSEYLRNLEDCIKGAAASIASYLDLVSFKMVVNTLKSEDPHAVKNAIDQLVKEKRPVAIPPLYLVSTSHPTGWVRAQAKKGLAELIEEPELTRLTEGKDVKAALGALIEKFGNYRG